MNVHITCTPEYSADKLNEIVSLLSSIPGELKFSKGKPLSQVQFKRMNPRFEDITEIDSLTFNEYFDLVQGYRELREIRDEDFIILISSIRHDLNWFSAFEKRNIFVRGDEWDIISNVDSKFGIAYQCVENIFQSLIDLDIMNHENEPNIHMEPIGCINDFCGYKPDILKKLRTADICDSCYNRYKQSGAGDVILAHIVSIIDEIRKEFVISKKFTNQLKLEKVKVDSDGNISIGDRLIKLATMPKVLYLGFLKQIEGIPNNQLCENRYLFDQIFKFIKRKNRNEYAIEKMFCKQITYNRSVEKQKPTFETYRTRIKDGLKTELGDVLASYYTVNLVEDENHKMLFKVSLTEDQLEIHPTFLK